MERSNRHTPAGESRRHPPFDRASLRSFASRLDELADSLTRRERAQLLALLEEAALPPAVAALRGRPARAVLTSEEVAIWQALADPPAPSRRALAPHLTLVMKATRACNLRCSYCRSWGSGPGNRMPFEVLARGIQGALGLPGVERVEFVWHGGEPTLVPRSFYTKAIWMQERLRRPGQRIVNNLQTNGTRLDARWARFLKDHGFQVGVSLDGPPEVHDLRRLDVVGRPTFERVQAGLARLEAEGYPRSVCLVVDEEVLRRGPRRLLEFLLENGVRSAGLLAVAPQGELGGADASEPNVDFPSYVEFQRQLFALWWPEHVEAITFREIDALIKRLRGEESSGYCVFENHCMGTAVTLDPEGGLWACDNFQGDPAYRFGNLHEMPFEAALGSANLHQARRRTAIAAAREQGCDWHRICRGGCPHDRSVRQRRSRDDGVACCGWAPLIAVISEAMGEVPPPSARWG